MYLYLESEQHYIQNFSALNILRSVDEMLPKSILDASQNILSVLGSVIVAAVVNPYFLLPVVILLILFILIRKVYLKTSKNLKRLEGIGEKI